MLVQVDLVINRSIGELYISMVAHVFVIRVVCVVAQVFLMI